ncbi:histone deacetylase 15-like isoform X1 [Asparagus officinalis]|uniref:histone deacetylase 15-like isoform X1 n=1 Tax=Asparagus officinalis TaxID=4686 RepID=UPI00098DF4DE|nr:histone deacetylase 15-like isoform X1 [Asparagus officinalis]
MPMASEALCMSNQKGSGLCAESKRHNKIKHVECQSNLSCSYEDAGKSHPQEINETSCYRETIQKGLIKTQNGAPGNAETSCHGIEHETSSTRQLEQNLDQRKVSTLQDLYMQDHYDDEDDDSDWEPVNHFIIKKWFCTNCTMPNFDDTCQCDVCGERKESEILGYHSFLTYFGQAAKVSLESDAVRNNQDLPSATCTAIGFDERMLLHSEVEMKTHPHPERPDRLRAIAASLVSAGIFARNCYVIPAREITPEELLLVHSSDHIETVQQTSQLFSSYFTSDTYANEHSACAARIAAGLCADLARSIVSGRTRNGFALVRPPGHHAGIKQAMGFCLHNNVAVAALAAQSAGAKKVLIVDWDVHHGNGTQEIFESNKSVLYISLHRHEGGNFYPGSGAVDEVGILDAEGYSVNIPWSCGGVGDNDYIFAFQNIVLPIASEFAPDITIISAGFDAARGDPLGCCDVTPAGYAQMTHMLTSLSQGKLLVVLEGGYNLRSISSSATAVVKVLLGENPVHEMSYTMPSKAGLVTVLQVLKIQLNFWPSLESNYTTLRSQWELVSSNMIISRKTSKEKKALCGPCVVEMGEQKVHLRTAVWCKKGSLVVAMIMKTLAYKKLLFGFVVSLVMCYKVSHFVFLLFTPCMIKEIDASCFALYK